MLSHLQNTLVKLGRIGISKFSSSDHKVTDLDAHTADVLLLFNMLVSLWSTAANADGTVDHPEEDKIEELLEKIFFEKNSEPAGLLSEELLLKLKTRKSDIMNLFYTYFKHPLTLSNIGEFAKQRKMTDFFYSQGSIIVQSNGKVEEKEILFLKELGDICEIPESKRKKLESKSLQEL